MGHIGNTVQTAFTTFDKQTITGNGGTTYTLTHSVANEREIEVFVNNVRQEPSVAYNVSGNTLTMTGNVASTDDFYVVYQGKAVQTASHPSTSPLQATTGTFSGAISVGTIKDSSSTNTALTIDSSGRILTPARPAFFAYLPSSQAISFASNTDITQYLTSIDFNIGNHYSAANGFQAPIDGIYHFDVGFYTYSVSYSELYIYKNGTKFQRFANILAASAVNPFSSRSSTTLSLSSGDEIKLYHSATTATLYHADRTTFFSGFLVG